MKRIRLKQIVNPDLSSHYIRQKMYSVSLGNNVNKWFSNKKDAARFLVMVNQELNDKLHELNYIYGYVFAEYRRVWFYMENYHQDKEQAIKNQMHYIDNAFKLACERSHFTNGNHFTFSHLYSAIESIDKICTIVKELLIERKHYTDVHRMDIFRNMLTIAKEGLDDLGNNYVPIGNEEQKLINGSIQ